MSVSDSQLPASKMHDFRQTPADLEEIHARLAMIVAETLGIPLERVEVVNSDTAIKPWDVGAHEYVHPAADTDGDGMSDYAEFIAGTNPTNAASPVTRMRTGLPWPKSAAEIIK